MSAKHLFARLSSHSNQDNKTPPHFSTHWLLQALKARSAESTSEQGEKLITAN
jgi:hypothetical protein